MFSKWCEIFPNFDFRHFNISHYDKKWESIQIAWAYFLVQLATKMENDSEHYANGKLTLI